MAQGDFLVRSNGPHEARVFRLRNTELELLGDAEDGMVCLPQRLQNTSAMPLMI